MSGQRIEKFEDLIAWQKARELTKGIYGVTKHGDFLKDFGLRDQIRRSSVSIMSNLAEGFERGGTLRISPIPGIRQRFLRRIEITTLCCLGC
jgi:hypothetical protein